MSSMLLYTGFVLAVAAERLVELAISKRNARWSFERGGVERGQGHFPFMVVLHTGLLVGCVAEVWFFNRAFVPVLGWPMLALAVVCQGLRYWVITTLGPRWNTRVIVVPGLPRIEGGPFRYIRHPNYVAVALEGLALPLIHGAWITAAVFTVLNAGLMIVRIRCEDAALDAAAEAVEAAG